MPDLTCKIIRVEREDGPLTRLPYVEDGRGEHYDFPAGETTFDVPPAIAQEAIASGFFQAVISEPAEA